MRKFLFILIALFSTMTMFGGATPARAAKRNIMELPLFERAILIIKHFETMHHPKHWPYVGYGHRVLPGEPYRKGCQLTEAQAEILLRKDLNKFCALYSKYGKDSILLGALAYNIGPGAVNKSSVLRLLKSGNRNIYKVYASHCHYKGKFHKGLYKRRLTELGALYMP